MIVILSEDFAPACRSKSAVEGPLYCVKINQRFRFSLHRPGRVFYEILARPREAKGCAGSFDCAGTARRAVPAARRM